MRRKRAIVYVLVGLTQDYDLLVRQAEAFARRRKLIVTEIISEGSPRQPRLLRLLSLVKSKRIKPDFIISPSLSNFSHLPKLLHTLARLQETGIGVGFVTENILLPGSATSTRSLYRVGALYVDAERQARRETIKQALRVRAFFGKSVGRERLPETVRRSAERELKSGKSLRAVVKALDLRGMRISRSSVANLRREMKKRGDL